MAGNTIATMQGPVVRVWSLIDLAIGRLAGLMLACSGICLIGLFGIATADVAGSQFFGRSVPSAFELQEMLMGMAIFGAFAAIQRRRAHIVVDVLTQRFTGVVRKLTDLIALSAGIVVFGLMTWQAGLLARRSVGVLELSPGYVPFPLYPVKLFVFLGCLVALLEFVRQLIRHLVFWSAEEDVHGGPAP
jgi:TRAP-type C4-dicarboxylate transport system permease small subunit